jgi:hypothetical protein
VVELHVLPHAPQLFESLVVSAQYDAPPSAAHNVDAPASDAQPHAPFVHVSLDAHLIPQPPQFESSVFVLVHVPASPHAT